MSDILIAFIFGCTLTAALLIPTALALLAVVRFTLRRCNTLATDRDQWQNAAANASVAARVAEITSRQDDEDLSGG